MTNERAKEILDFLARRAGYNEFAIDSSCKARIYSENDNYTSHLFEHISDKPNTKHFEFVVVSARSNSYAKILEKIFKIAHKGHRIETIDDYIFLPANYFLEQILVEMDLENDR